VLVLVLLVVGLALGYAVPRRGIALGATAALWAGASALVLVRSGTAYAVDADSVGVWAMTALAPIGCGLGRLLRGRRPKRSATRAS
jgi:hypothetical protein